MHWVMPIIGVILTVALLAWIASSDRSATATADDVNVSCIDGVEYWYREAGYKGFMAPRVDPETLSFVRC